MNQIQNIGLVEIGVVVIADAAIVLFIMQYSVRERTKEIGTFKAMGASSTTILGQFIFEGILLSLIAAVIAIAIDIVGATTLANLLLPHPVENGQNYHMSANGHLDNIASHQHNPDARNYSSRIRLCSRVRRAWKFVSSVEGSKNQTSGGNEI